MANLTALQLNYGLRGKESTFKMAFDLAFPAQALIHRFLSQSQLCDPPLVQALTGFLQPGDTFIDVGSHIGYYSLFALQMVGPTGHVFAFEPNPLTFSVLLANIMLNRTPNLFAFNSAVGSAPGIATFNINSEDEGMSSLVYRSSQSTQVSVHVTSLDQMAQTVGLGPVRMMKIDVEGFEEQVIKGGMDLLARGHVESITFEINNIFPGIPKYRDLMIRQTLRELGYSSYLIRPWMGEPQWEAKFGALNYLRVPDDQNIEINYGNILATKRPVEAATL